MKNPVPSSPLDTCPFCGKPFKRLKSHLPHCKMAKSKKNSESPAGDTQMVRDDIQISRINRNLRDGSLVSMGTVGANNKGKVKMAAVSDAGQHTGMLQEGSEPITTKLKVSRVTTDSKLTQRPERQHKDVTNVRSWKTPAKIDSEFDNSLDILYLQGGSPSSNVQEHILFKHSSNDSTHPMLSGLDVKVAIHEQVTKNLFGVELGEHLPQTVPEGSLPESQDLSDKNTPVGSQTQNGLLGTWQNLHTDRNRLLPEHEDLTTEIGWGTGEVLVPGKTLVWDHLKGSLCGKTCLENRNEILKQIPLLSHNTKSSQIDAPYGPKQERLRTQMLGDTFAVQLQPPAESHSALGSSGKTMENIWNLKLFLDAAPESKPETLSSQSLSGVSPDRSLGMQWIPELYPNYMHLHVVPGRQDDWNTEKTTVTSRIPTETQHDVSLLSKHLMDVRLGELSSWIANQHFSIQSLARSAPNAWDRYYNKYINVKRGGVGGLTMMLAGYCVLSYAWNYKHIQQDRRRRFH
ncbi:uncharacterized protein C17orf80 homolog [Pelobates fuscus]|uniref:uncharacterized protein C17orf80 homolog n=1 Tax=Pelobates fuscus TaxID=191477 RepID=UPI002FE4EBEF